MRTRYLGTLAIALSIVSCGIATTLFAQDQTYQGKTCYPPEYTSSDEFILPKNFHEWVYVGSPLTPNALNGGMATFPEFHNVYIEPCSYEKYKQTNVFAVGQVMSRAQSASLN
jgi:hypothetical protein